MLRSSNLGGEYRSSWSLHHLRTCAATTFEASTLPRKCQESFQNSAVRPMYWIPSKALPSIYSNNALAYSSYCHTNHRVPDTSCALNIRKESSFPHRQAKMRIPPDQNAIDNWCHPLSSFCFPSPERTNANHEVAPLPTHPLTRSPLTPPPSASACPRRGCRTWPPAGARR